MSLRSPLLYRGSLNQSNAIGYSLELFKGCFLLRGVGFWLSSGFGQAWLKLAQRMTLPQNPEGRIECWSAPASCGIVAKQAWAGLELFRRIVCIAKAEPSISTDPPAIPAVNAIRDLMVS